MEYIMVNSVLYMEIRREKWTPISRMPFCGYKVLPKIYSEYLNDNLSY